MSIVITGNPGVGKHTITEEISKILALSIMDINSIAKDEGLVEENGDANDVDTEKLRKILEGRISEKNVIVGHLAPYVLSKNKVKTIIVLRRNPYDLISVYNKRKYTNKKAMENIGCEILGIIAHDAINKFQEKTFQIDNSDKNIQGTVKKIMTVIFQNEGSETIDWLSTVTKNNDLKKFFPD